MDTIYALSSGAAPAGVAVIRLSGPAAGPVLASMAGALPEARRAALRVVRRRSDGAPIDDGLILWFPGPGSFTGEDMAEIHVHGARAVIQAVFDSLSEHGCRLAQAGEFARRAHANCRLDLTQAEGLADLIASETELQRRQAYGQAGGGLARAAEIWRERILHLRADIEARLDFADEDDVPEALPGSFWVAVGALRSELRDALASASTGERLREGFRVAIMGYPNAGKSSLLNALAKQDVAIVTAEAGTTRDILAVPLDLGGYPVVLFDTAGLRESASLAEQEGVRRARLAAESADLILWLAEQADDEAGAAALVRTEVWTFRSKVDLQRDGAAGISVTTGQGLTELVARLEAAAAQALGRGDALVTRQRQKEAIAEALTVLEHAEGVPEEIAADLLRAAGEAIGRLSGRIDVEEVLDRLFSEFCVGK